MKRPRSLVLSLLVAAAAVHLGCGVMFGDVEDECTGSCNKLTDCPISACGCQNKVARLGISCSSGSSGGGCCIAPGSVCDQLCEGHGGVAKIDTLGCNFVADCSACATSKCNCWGGVTIPAGCVSTGSQQCCLTGVKDYQALCHGLCAEYGGLQSVSP